MITLSLVDLPQQVPLQQWQFEQESVIRVGRALDNQVVLNHILVSRYHLELHRADQNGTPAWQLMNRGKNGTFLDGVMVSKAALPSGSLIQLAQGGPVLKFEIERNTQPQTGWLGSSQANRCSHAKNPQGNLFCMTCGHPLQVKQIVRQYLILKTLGQGGMGTTYLACDRDVLQASINDKTHSSASSLRVLKQMNDSMVQIAKAQELFEREARVMKSLKHPGIPQFYDFFTEGEHKYLVMEMIHGLDLEQWIYQHGPVSPKKAVDWMVQTCEILDYLHTQDPPVIHRDIKPANLMLRHYDQRIMMLDFGAVKEIGTPYGTRIGAEAYAAPEQNRGRPVTQSDLYAIGPTLIFLLTKQAPSNYYEKQGGEYRFNLESLAMIPPFLKAVIERITEPRPTNRYQSAEQLIQMLKSAVR